MSDAATQGVGCLALATPIMATAYQQGPTEIMMLLSGAVIVPSSNAQLFIALGGILGAAACGVGAVLTPSAIWMAEWFDTANTPADPPEPTANAPQPAQPELPEIDDLAAVQDAPVEAASEMGEDGIQGLGCFLGVLGLSAITLATAPIEIVGLAAGGVGIPSSSAILLLSIVGTVVPSGCTLGAAASLPLLSLYRSMDLGIGKGLASLFGWGREAQPAPTTLQVKAKEPQARSNVEGGTRQGSMVEDGLDSGSSIRAIAGA